MDRWSYTCASSQHVLADHELAVVLAYHPAEGLESRIGQVGTVGPLPSFAIKLPNVIGSEGCSRTSRVKTDLSVIGARRTLSHCLPLRLGGEPRLCPTREGVSLVIAHM